KGYDSKFGARPLKRAIQKYIEDLLADEIVNNKIKEGDKILLTLNEEKDGLVSDIIKNDAVKDSENESK
ncbi:MAG TPA: hypothetical protein VKX31_00050, partial [Brumimicrobium sp.]|nr:hypothetical protein [Brumimicrobium sp.]